MSTLRKPGHNSKGVERHLPSIRLRPRKRKRMLSFFVRFRSDPKFNDLMGKVF